MIIGLAKTSRKLLRDLKDRSTVAPRTGSLQEFIDENVLPHLRAVENSLLIDASIGLLGLI
jgi:hypothetical protein